MNSPAVDPANSAPSSETDREPWSPTDRGCEPNRPRTVVPNRPRLWTPADSEPWTPADREPWSATDREEVLKGCRRSETGQQPVRREHGFPGGQDGPVHGIPGVVAVFERGEIIG